MDPMLALIRMVALSVTFYIAGAVQPKWDREPIKRWLDGHQFTMLCWIIFLHVLFLGPSLSELGGVWGYIVGTAAAVSIGGGFIAFIVEHWIYNTKKIEEEKTDE